MDGLHVTKKTKEQTDGWVTQHDGEDAGKSIETHQFLFSVEMALDDDVDNDVDAADV